MVIAWYLTTQWLHAINIKVLKWHLSPYLTVRSFPLQTLLSEGAQHRLHHLPVHNLGTSPPRSLYTHSSVTSTSVS